MKRIIGITGWKNSGKTTLAERLIAELSLRGYTVASVKHAHHAFDIDHEGTDSWRHRRAGAREVAVVSDRRWALMHELQEAQEPTLDAIVARLSPCDIVIVEGYKREGHPKIEARRNDAADATSMAGRFPNIVAIAADHSTDDFGLPVFDLDDIAAIANFVVRYLGIATPTDPA